MKLYALNDFFWFLYVLWGMLAGLVGWHFIQGAHQTWREAGGSMRGFFKELLVVPRYVARMCWKDLKDIVTRRRLEKESASDMPYTAGHLLRFFTAVSFLAIAMIGIIFRNVDRGEWPIWFIALNSTAVCISVAACLGHLYIRWMDRPRLWRWTVVGSIAWIAFMPFAGALI